MAVQVAENKEAFGVQVQVAASCVFPVAAPLPVRTYLYQSTQLRPSRFASLSPKVIRRAANDRSHGAISFDYNYVDSELRQGESYVADGALPYHFILALSAIRKFQLATLS